MTVKELIEKLKEVPEDTEIVSKGVGGAIGMNIDAQLEIDGNFWITYEE